MKQRLYSIDALRGLALAGMILVNNPGSWGHIYTPFEHAPFEGLTLADLVFPTFMFVMGLCIPISLSRYEYKPSALAFSRILRRTLLILGTGLFLQWMSSGWCSWGELRISGVLQRLALCYGLCATLLLISKRAISLTVITLILLGYSILLYYNQGYEWSEENIIAKVDHYLLGSGHLYVDEGIRLDPEGLLSTISSLAHVMLGAFMMLLYRDENEEPAFKLYRKGKSKPAQQIEQDPSLPNQKQNKFIKYLLIYAFSAFLISIDLHYSGFPIIKKVWSTSFVLCTTAIASFLLAGMIWLFDVKRWSGWWSLWLVVFGRNPLIIYIVSWVLADWFGQWGVTWSTYHWLTAYCSPNMASLLYAILFAMVNWLIAFALYKSKVRFSA